MPSYVMHCAPCPGLSDSSNIRSRATQKNRSDSLCSYKYMEALYLLSYWQQWLHPQHQLPAFGKNHDQSASDCGHPHPTPISDLCCRASPAPAPDYVSSRGDDYQSSNMAANSSDPKTKPKACKVNISLSPFS